MEQYGTKEEVYEKPKNTFVAKLIGDPPMNLIPGTIIKKNGRSFLSVDGIDFDLKGDVDGGEAILGIRPYNVVFTPQSSTDSVRVEIYSFERYGMNTVVSAKIGDGTCKIKIEGMQRFNIGETAHVLFDLKNSHIFNSKGELVKILGNTNG